MKKRVDSQSDVQQKVEEFVFEGICNRLNDSTLERNTKLPLDTERKTFICPDFYSEQSRIIGEIHAHIGRLKGSQPDKIASDVLKMVLYEKKHGKYKKFIAVCDREECEQLKGSSFLAEAIRSYDVDVLLIDLPEEKKKQLMDSMHRQNLMLNQK